MFILQYQTKNNKWKDTGNSWAALTTAIRIAKKPYWNNGKQRIRIVERINNVKWDSKFYNEADIINTRSLV